MADEIFTTLVNECLLIATNEIQANQNGKFHFHNLEHTLNVFKAITVISENTPEVSDREMELLQIAALFHDIYACRSIKEHEKDSAEFARNILESKKVSEDDIVFVERIILSTKLNYKPTDIFEKIIKDADISHLGNKNYINTPFINLFKEIKTCYKAKHPKEWINDCLDFFDHHPYFTPYAKENFVVGKEKNKEKLKALAEMEINTEEELIEKTTKKKKKKNKSNADKPDKGIETMFRVNLRNHVNLSRIADDKANTLISVNAIIISIVLSTLFPKLDNNAFLMWPALILVAFSIITIIISIVSTIPRTTHGLMTKDDIINKRGNLTFFGNFHRMNLADFEWGIEELMKDRDYLYKSMSRDLYFLGIVLKKKYTFLRWGYIIFVAGLLISCLFFVLGIMSYYKEFAG